MGDGDGGGGLRFVVGIEIVMGIAIVMGIGIGLDEDRMAEWRNDENQKDRYQEFGTIRYYLFVWLYVFGGFVTDVGTNDMHDFVD